MEQNILEKIVAEYKQFDRVGWHWPFAEIRAFCQNYDYSTTVGSDPNNRILNRYRLVVPYDHTRVVLQQGPIKYINANTVEVPQANRTYILTQGPLKHTIPHFWQMLWEQNSNVIIMLNQIYERNQKSCEIYWPERIGAPHMMEFHDSNLTVTFLSETEHTGYHLRNFVIKDQTTLKERNVKQYHLLMWPDFGVPSSLDAFVNFLDAVRTDDMCDTNNHPPIVHCSAGIGRSGSFCVIDAALSIIERGNHTLNIMNLILEMRKSRMGLIQTLDQLRFTYAVIIESLRAKVTNAGGHVEEPLEEEAPPLPPRRAESLPAPMRPLPPHPGSDSGVSQEHAETTNNVVDKDDVIIISSDDDQGEPESESDDVVMSDSQSEMSAINPPFEKEARESQSEMSAIDTPIEGDASEPQSEMSANDPPIEEDSRHSSKSSIPSMAAQSVEVEAQPQVSTEPQTPTEHQSSSLRRRRTQELADRVSDMRRRARTADRWQNFRKPLIKKMLFVLITIAIVYAFSVSSIFSSH